MKGHISSIFPTPVYCNELSRSFSTKELSFINDIKDKNVFKNTGNYTSDNCFILEEPVFKDIKKELNLFIKDYFDSVIQTSDKIIPYITQSWLNFTSVKEFHHKHFHPNSLVSGVLYIDVGKEDCIQFFKEDRHQSQIALTTREYNLFNSSCWYIPVKNKDVILFPSSTEHAVDIKKENNVRISLAFNVFIKGEIGSKLHLTYLKL
jgi:uncharacterized protein (TIGR02466 family)